MKRGLFVALVGLALLVGLFALTFKGRRTAPVAVETNVPLPGTNAVPVTDPQMHSPTGTQKASYVPPDVSTPELRKLVDRRCSYEERVHGATTGAIPEVKDERDLKALVQVLSEPEEDETVRHEIANLLFRSEYVGLQDALFRILENPAEKSLFRGWAVQHLGKLLSSGGQVGVSNDLDERMRQLLTDRHIEVRRQALLSLVNHNDPKAIEEVVKWLKAEGAEADRMRDLAIRCAHEKNVREHIPTIRNYTRSTNDIIRIQAIVALSEWGDEESRPACEEAAKSTVVRVQRCGQVALKRLDGQKPAKPDAVPAE